MLCWGSIQPLDTAGKLLLLIGPVCYDDRCSESTQLADIAEAVQVKLDSYKADKRELGSVSFTSCFSSFFKQSSLSLAGTREIKVSVDYSGPSI